MTINYKLTIGQIKKRKTLGALSDVIIEVHFYAEAESVPVVEQVGENEDGSPVMAVKTPQFSASRSYYKEFDVSALDQNNFIPFDQISKQVIVQWLLDGEGVENLEDFSYVRDAISNVRQKISNYGLEETVSLPGDGITGSSTVI